MSYADLAALAEAAGLTLRGGFLAGPEDGVPEAAPGRPAHSLVLLGSIGGSLWPAFSRSPEAGDRQPHSLDRWSQRVIGELAAAVGARALFPFGGPPWLPFQCWAQRAEPVASSPLGILIHPRHGLWHAYRGALAFAEVLELPPHETGESPCERCSERPCLTACPVDAFTDAAYDVQGCTAHISIPGGAECLQGGCLARRACPVAPELAYEAAQATFHMRAFLTSRRREQG